ncbi:MAG: rRNA maturation RNase YbeY [Lachnospiraceae bacterium]|nr:rRNA maturation RNase YbeY [Lachnospiraceae bacterium]MDE7436262.1 rRNA maturation RNase YbeY [Lachnospiraceae bacterium]
MTITIARETKLSFDFDYETLAKDVIMYTIKHEHFPYDAEVNLTLTGLDEIQWINKSYRQIDSPTDVLSFPMLSYDAPGDFSKLKKDSLNNFNPDTGDVMLGDIILCVPKVLFQAVEYGHSARREFAFLIVHSMLHLFGYDHMTDEDAQLMERKQQEILEELQISR